MGIATESVSSIVGYIEAINNFISSYKNKSKEMRFYFRGEKYRKKTTLLF